MGTREGDWPCDDPDGEGSDEKLEEVAEDEVAEVAEGACEVVGGWGLKPAEACEEGIREGHKGDEGGDREEGEEGAEGGKVVRETQEVKERHSDEGMSSAVGT